MIRRGIQALVVLVGVSIIVFVLLHLLPGGPARAVLGARATPALIRTFDRQYGLNKPIIIQYWIWLLQVLHGNLGFSYKLNQSVDSLLAENLPRTAALVGIATVLALVIGIPLGIYQAVRRNRVDDYVLTGMVFFFYSTPSFLLGILLIFLFAMLFPILPSTGPNGTVPFTDQLANLVLPVATLCLLTMALFSRYMRASMVDNLVQDYVRTARAKGLSLRQVIFGHVVRNALLPVVTLIGLSLPGILSGAIIVEALFNYPGMGYLFWQSAQTEDYPVLMGFTLVVGASVVVGSLLADVLYAVLDPRVRYT